MVFGLSYQSLRTAVVYQPGISRHICAGCCRADRERAVGRGNIIVRVFAQSHCDRVFTDILACRTAQRVVQRVAVYNAILSCGQLGIGSAVGLTGIIGFYCGRLRSDREIRGRSRSDVAIGLGYGCL